IVKHLYRKMANNSSATNAYDQSLLASLIIWNSLFFLLHAMYPIYNLKSYFYLEILSQAAVFIAFLIFLLRLEFNSSNFQKVGLNTCVIGVGLLVIVKQISEDQDGK
ncbi:hypothetical protein CEXT_279151, partial [Caerostris extrusa]